VAALEQRQGNAQTGNAGTDDQGAGGQATNPSREIFALVSGMAQFYGGLPVLAMTPRHPGRSSEFDPAP
jgi:hypothetical protein